MIKYHCENCGLSECETSICPACGNKSTLKKTEIFWSDYYNTPSFDEYCSLTGESCKYISSDLRPVFPEERLLLEILENKPFAYAGKSIWNLGKNIYIINGEKKLINYKKLMTENKADDVINRLNELNAKNQKYIIEFYKNEYILAFIKLNNNRLNVITAEAISYINSKTTNVEKSDLFVSFSGGKDSTVVSDLVRRTLGTNKILHMYGDTTLEYPLTEEYIKKFKKNYPDTPMLIAKNNDQEFNDLCTVIGPPSRVNRWCCTVFKTGAISKKIEMTFKNKKRIYSFQGIRRNESLSRSKYDRDSDSPKISKQHVLAPIIDWLDFDVWLYILSNKIIFNESYRLGFSRVGCWCCPNNSNWSSYLSSIYMNEQYLRFYNVLYDFAKKVGKEDWQVYVDEGMWKARQGGNGLEISKNAVIDFKPCAFDESTYNFELTKPINEDLYELFKPFGILNFDIGNKLLKEVYVLDRVTNEPILKLTGRLGKNNFKVTVIKKVGKLSKINNFENYIKAQIVKFQTCLACSGCNAACKFNAIQVINTKKGSVSNDAISYKILDRKCVGCLDCVLHYANGCYMKKVLRTKKEGK